MIRGAEAVENRSTYTLVQVGGGTGRSRPFEDLDLGLDVGGGSG
jgi:hypothetical protein